MHLEMDGWKMTISVLGPRRISAVSCSEDMDAQMPGGWVEGRARFLI